MKKSVVIVGLAAMTLAACEPYETTGAAQTTMTVARVPAGVLEIADPSQDLSNVQIDRETGCYVYVYKGIVETTLLPLRTKDGNPICARKQS